MARITKIEGNDFTVRMKSGKESYFTRRDFDYGDPEVGDDVTVRLDADETEHITLNHRADEEPKPDPRDPQWYDAVQIIKFPFDDRQAPKAGSTDKASAATSPAATVVKTPPKTAQTVPGKGKPNNGKQPFYQRTWFLVLMIFLFPVIGLVMLFLPTFRKRYKRGAWIALLVLAAIFVLFRAIVLFTPSSRSSSNTNASVSEQTAETQSEPSDNAKGDDGGQAEQQSDNATPQASTDINEALPDGYAYITPADLQKYSPNLSGVKVYTVAKVDDVDSDQVQITLDSGFMMSSFKTSTDYTSILSDDETVAIYGTVDSYHDYGGMGTSVDLSGCHVFATGDAASDYAKDASDSSLSQYFTLTGEVANASNDDLSKDDYIALCTTPSYDSIMRNPDQYKDTYVKVSGTVDQIIEGWFDTYTIYVRDAGGNKWEVSYYYSDGESHVLEGDAVTVYGQCEGTTNSTTVLGKQVTLPSIDGKYIVS